MTAATLAGLLLLCGWCRDGAADDDDAPPERRVSSGLLALYDFESLDGAVLKDQSGAKPPLNLRVSDPKAVRHSPGGLEIAEAVWSADD